MVEPGWVRREVLKNQKIGAARPTIHSDRFIFRPQSRSNLKHRNIESSYLRLCRNSFWSMTKPLFKDGRQSICDWLSSAACSKIQDYSASGMMRRAVQ